MPVAAAHVVLTASERRRLKRLARSRTLPYQQVLRAQTVRSAACGRSNATIAGVLQLKVDTVRKWRGRFAARGLDGLKDLPRCGRPPHFTALQRAEVKALACALPATRGVPLSRWTSADLAAEVTAAGIAASMSASTVRRILAKDAIKPWQYRSWISVRDPQFRVKAARVLELYQRRWQGQALADDEYVLSSDEKTSIQARCRCHPTLPPGRSRPMRVEHDYDRGGALAYLAAYDVHAGTVTGRCAPSTGIEQFHALVDQVMNTEPYRSAKRVFWVVDNGSSHRGQAAIDRLAARWPNCVLVHTPVHASWLNQMEIYFSIIQRKVVSPNDFTDLDQIQQRLAAFEKRYNTTPTAFDWKFTADDLDNLLARLDQHQAEPTSANVV